MATMHEVVVRGAMRAGQAKHLSKRTRRSSNRICALRARETDSLRKARPQHVKGLRGNPHAVLARIDVGKEPQDTVAASGTRRERIDMRQVIASAEPGGTPTLLERAIAGEIQFPAPRVGRQKFA